MKLPTEKATISYMRKMLTGLDIQLAFVFGSVVNGTARADSDIDLLVVAGTRHWEIMTACGRIDTKLGRRVDLQLYSSEEWPNAGSSCVVATIINGPKWMIIGDEPPPVRFPIEDVIA